MDKDANMSEGTPGEENAPSASNTANNAVAEADANYVNNTNNVNNANNAIEPATPFRSSSPTARNLETPARTPRIGNLGSTNTTNNNGSGDKDDDADGEDLVPETPGVRRITNVGNTSDLARDILGGTRAAHASRSILGIQSTHDEQSAKNGSHRSQKSLSSGGKRRSLAFDNAPNPNPSDPSNASNASNPPHNPNSANPPKSHGNLGNFDDAESFGGSSLPSMWSGVDNIDGDLGGGGPGGNGGGGGGDGGDGGGGGGDDNNGDNDGDNDNNNDRDNFDSNNPNSNPNRTSIRGTEVSIQEAAIAFTDFIQNFVSVEESERVLAKASKGTRTIGDADMEDDADDEKKDEQDEEDIKPKKPLYIQKLEEILLFGHTTPPHDSMVSDSAVRGAGVSGGNGGNGGNGLTNADPNANTADGNPDGTSTGDNGNNPQSKQKTLSLDLNTLHLYYHSPACQRLYSWLVDYPSEIIPLMDLVVMQELNGLNESMRRREEERILEAEGRLAELEQLIGNGGEGLNGINGLNQEAQSDYVTEMNLLQTQIQSSTHLLSLLPSSQQLPHIQLRPYHLRHLSHMRSLSPLSIDSLLSLRGMVVRTSSMIPDLKVAFFSCSICGHGEQVTVDRGRISEPTQCPMCNVRNGYGMIHNRCCFSDKQMIRVQETPDEVPPGETPASIVIFSYDDLVDAVRPGDRVEVTGVMRAQARRVGGAASRVTKVGSVWKTYVDCVHWRRVVGGGEEREREVGREREMGRNDASNDAHGGGDGDNANSNTNTILNNISNMNNPSNKKKPKKTIFSPERLSQLQALSRQPDIYERLVQALAPSIWEMDDVKKGVLCMLFGGNTKRVRSGTDKKRREREERKERKEREREERREMRRWEGLGDEGETESESEEEEEEEVEEEDVKLNKRGDINILLVGDPGTSKSQLLSYVHKLSLRGVYTSGKGSSAVGLTASVVRDPETKELVMESGALVLSDLGICCIDEFDKMSATTRAILHEAMEQQTVSIAKAGIIATLNARTSILASANPVESRYNPSISVVENIQLPPTLLSRFDLIYLILDAPSVENDRKLAQHLVGLYYDTPDVVEPPMDHALLRDYITYARENIHPEISDVAANELCNAYIKMRGGGRRGDGGSVGTGRTITATPRQLESLVRLSEALARMRYSNVVIRTDVLEAVRLMQVATQAAATDPRTGKIDMDMIATGRSTAEREKEEGLVRALKELFTERKGNRMSVTEIKRMVGEVWGKEVGNEELVEVLRGMEADSLIQFNERNQTVFVRAGVMF